MTDQERYEQEFQTSGSTKKDYFDGAEKVRFGDRVDAPPVMPKLRGIFKKRAENLDKKKQQQQQGKRGATGKPNYNGSYGSSAGNGGGRPTKKARR